MVWLFEQPVVSVPEPSLQLRKNHWWLRWPTLHWPCWKNLRNLLQKIAQSKRNTLQILRILLKILSERYRNVQNAAHSGTYELNSQYRSAAVVLQTLGPLTRSLSSTPSFELNGIFHWLLPDCSVTGLQNLSVPM